MSYEKPHVALIASAVETIKSMAKENDNPEVGGLVSASAYEADE